MDCDTSPPSLPITSDPPDYDDWNLDECTAIVPSSTHTDELEAQQLLQKETNAFKTRERQVIRHRSWRLAEVFLSEQDYPEGDNCRIE